MDGCAMDMLKKSLTFGIRHAQALLRKRSRKILMYLNSTIMFLYGQRLLQMYGLPQFCFR
eukprot:4117971-Karenia_brevis.AAC.1